MNIHKNQRESLRGGVGVGGVPLSYFFFFSLAASNSIEMSTFTSIQTTPPPYPSVCPLILNRLLYRVYQSIRLNLCKSRKLISFGSRLVSFEVNDISWGDWDSSKYRLRPKSNQAKLVQISYIDSTESKRL